ncbi:unnamed protein product [Pieris macdunnoughi]|uniref:Uncharacterized protein n=1 Tax=Pieris macdunnoughi TaxID=345717 RepID=A0A821WRU2_9NEOP|nr:unnamed protein product [Pieris macdunnoughi]
MSIVADTPNTKDSLKNLSLENKKSKVFLLAKDPGFRTINGHWLQQSFVQNKLGSTRELHDLFHSTSSLKVESTKCDYHMSKTNWI